MRLIIEEGDFPGVAVEELLGPDYGFRIEVVARGGDRPRAVLKYRGAGHALEPDRVAVEVPNAAAPAEVNEPWGEQDWTDSINSAYEELQAAAPKPKKSAAKKPTPRKRPTPAKAA